MVNTIPKAQLLANSDVFCPHDLVISRISCKWNRVECSLSNLTSFTWCDTIEILSCYISCVCSVTQLCPAICDPMSRSPRLLFPAIILEWVALSWTQGSIPHFLCLLHWQVGSLPLSHLGSLLCLTTAVNSFLLLNSRPAYVSQFAYPFSSWQTVGLFGFLMIMNKTSVNIHIVYMNLSCHFTWMHT